MDRPRVPYCTGTTEYYSTMHSKKLAEYVRAHLFVCQAVVGDWWDRFTSFV